MGGEWVGGLRGGGGWTRTGWEWRGQERWGGGGGERKTRAGGRGGEKVTWFFTPSLPWLLYRARDGEREKARAREIETDRQTETETDRETDIETELNWPCSPLKSNKIWPGQKATGTMQLSFVCFFFFFFIIFLLLRSLAEHCGGHPV